MLVGANVRVNSRDTCNGRGVTQSETAIATSGNAVVVAYNDFRGYFCDSGYQFTGWGYSLDGGVTFTDGGPLPGGHDLGGDAWLAVTPDGTFLLSSLYHPLDSMAVLRGTPTDTGISWSNPTILSGGGPYDKEAIAVDPNGGTIYLAYTRVGSGISLYKSTDGGVSFTGPTDVNTRSDTQGASLAVGPNGEVYVAYDVGYPNDRAIGIAWSLDGGRTFQNDSNIQPTQRFVVSGTDRYPAYPHIAVDTTGGPNNGNIYIAWQSAHLSGKGDALLTVGTLSGSTITWTDPVKINDDNGTGIQFEPTISVDADGNLDAFFYDRRDNPGTTLTNLYFARSEDGGRTFDPNVLVTSVASNWHLINEGSPMWGEYMNSVSAGNDAMVAYADGRDGDPDAYFTRVSFG
jgi:hypothetical protein